MNKKVKPSLYIHTTETESGDLLIFNGAHGVNSIRKVCKEKKDKISQVFSQKEIIINQEDEDSDIKKLYDTNYLIPYDFDEKAVRKLKYIEKVAGNVLYLVIHTTTDCNFRCQYCALDFEKKHMSLDTQEAVISFVRKNI